MRSSLQVIYILIFIDGYALLGQSSFRTIVCAGEDSFIWRYDYVTDETLNEWANWKSEP